MRRHLAAAAFVVAALTASAEAKEVVTVPVADGVTVSYLLAVPERGAKAVALLFPGSYGKTDLPAIAGRLRLQRGNFLVRARGQFVSRGVATAVIDTPSDQPDGMTDEFRLGARHAKDMATVVADLKKRVGDVPVFVVGTSRGSISAAALGARLGGDVVAGSVLTSSMYRPANPRSPEPGPGLSRFDFKSLKLPVLLVHHKSDGCYASPYGDAHSLSKQFPLVSVTGGSTPESQPCQALSPHGYIGKEGETVEAIVNWMLGTPYRRDID